MDGEETRVFLGFVSEGRLYGLFHLLVMTGLRRGEVMGLRWEDVDLEGDGACGAPAPGPPGPGLVEVAPEGAASRRTLMVDPTTVGVLRRHRWRQQKEAEDHGRGGVKVV